MSQAPILGLAAMALISALGASPATAFAAASATKTFASGKIIGTGAIGGQTSSIRIDTSGDGIADATISIEQPSQDMTDRIQDAIENGFLCFSVVDNDGDGKIDSNEEIFFETCPPE